MATQKKGIFGGSGGGELAGDDQAFLSQIEENIRSKGNEQVDAAKEAEHRAREMERIRLASDHVKVPGRNNPTPAGGTSSAPKAAAAPQKANPLENDPRYKEYFERLRRQKGDKSGSTPAVGTPSQSVSDSSASAGAAGSQKVGPGSVVRFDDGSIGVYKDAVSGRDYALFYFLNPDGQVQPEGVFLQCYQAKVIGHLPEEYFAEMRDASAWNRDMIVFHLAKFEFVAELDRLAEHEERKPKNTTPARNASVQAPVATQTSTPAPVASTPPQGTPQQTASSSVDREPEPQPAPAKSEEGLVKGRRFNIKFGGKQWEAVYWTSEDDNAIVAHNTHGSWSLMRLDLTRFKDSLELLEVVDSETLDQIATQVIS